MNYNSLTGAMRTYRARVYPSLEGEIYKFLRSQHSIIPLGMKYMCALARTVEFRSQFGLITQIGKC